MPSAAAIYRGVAQFAAGLVKCLQGEGRRPLLIVSSDMNHFASDDENRRLDELALAAMETLDPERLYETVRKNHISMCGLLPAVIVMETLRQMNMLSRSQRVAYATSADVTGDGSARRRLCRHAAWLIRPSSGCRERASGKVFSSRVLISKRYGLDRRAI